TTSSCCSLVLLCICAISHLHVSYGYNVVFFLMIRRPPRSTLFPTRRSSDLATRRSGPARQSNFTREVASSERQLPASSVLSASRDRKSTRLNSSHVKISYAVFCLKKKNILT